MVTNFPVPCVISINRRLRKFMSFNNVKRNNGKNHNNYIRIFVLICIMGFTFCGFTFGLDFQYGYRTPSASDENYFNLSFVNDGYLGSAVTEDWDDGRSFGFYTEGTFLKDFNYKFQLDGITSRADQITESEDCRTDNMQIQFNYRIFDLKTDNSRVELGTGIVFDLFANLGLYYVQKYYHQMIKLDRAIPEKYISPIFCTQFNFWQRFSYGTRYILDLRNNIFFSTFVEPGLDISVLLWDSSRKSQIYIGLGYTSLIQGNRPEIIYTSEYREKGLNLQYGINIGRISYFRTINAASPDFRKSAGFKSFGGLGINFGKGINSDSPDRNGNFILEQGLPIDGIIRTLILWQPGFLWNKRPEWTNRTGFYIDSGNGFNNGVSVGRPMERYEYLSFGLRIFLFKPCKGWQPQLYFDSGIGLIWKVQYAKIEEHRAVSDNTDISVYFEFREGLYIPLAGFKSAETAEYGITLFCQQGYDLTGRQTLEAMSGYVSNFAITWGMAFTVRDMNLYSGNWINSRRNKSKGSY